MLHATIGFAEPGCASLAEYESQSIRLNGAIAQPLVPLVPPLAPTEPSLVGWRRSWRPDSTVVAAPPTDTLQPCSSQLQAAARRSSYQFHTQSIYTQNMLGCKTDTRMGVSILLSGRGSAAWERAGREKHAAGPRLLAVRLVLRCGKRGTHYHRKIGVFLVSAYAPTTGHPAAAHDAYYDDLSRLIARRQPGDVLVVCTALAFWPPAPPPQGKPLSRTKLPRSSAQQTQDE